MLSMMSVEALLQEVARENFGSSNSASPSEFGGDSSVGFFSVKRELQRRRQLKMVGQQFPKKTALGNKCVLGFFLYNKISNICFGISLPGSTQKTCFGSLPASSKTDLK